MEKKARKRPAVLVRFQPADIRRLKSVCLSLSLAIERFAREAIMHRLVMAESRRGGHLFDEVISPEQDIPSAKRVAAATTGARGRPRKTRRKARAR